jgi:3-oxoacyl-[acyl-carrier-protein] synthase II
MAAGLIQQGRVDAMVAGGADAAASPLAATATARAGALSKFGVSRPFDARRDGFVLSEGAGALVLEELALARARGAPILAELSGYGASCDAFHLTAPDPSAVMPARAITIALQDAAVEPSEVDYVNAHGTATVLNDRMETLALKMALGSHSLSIPVSSLKSAIGHPCGAAGAIEAVASIETIRTGTAPPTLNYGVAEEDLDLDYVTSGAIALTPPSGRRLTVLSNSFGFGGHNAVLCLRGID